MNETEKQTHNIPTCNTLISEQSMSRPSFREAFRRAAEQTELNIYAKTETGEQAFHRELCLIIAEVYVLRAESKVKVSDEVLDAYLVQEVFSELRFEHLAMVRDNFCKLTHLVNNKRAYLRTALYNSVFELESHYENLFKVKRG